MNTIRIPLHRAAAWQVANVFCLLTGVLIFDQAAVAGSGDVPAADAPALSAFQTNWPRFRGWDGSGAATQNTYGTNLVWCSPIPAPGHSSPVVWGNRVFITGGSAAKREVFCYHAFSGALLWRRTVENVPGSPANVAEVPEDTTYAASTMATDGRRVYAIFANGDLGAFNFDGSLAWSKYLGLMKNSYGYATSLAVWQNQLLVQLDQGEGTAEGSKLISLNGADGRVSWERNRAVPASWATPMVVETAGKTQIITLANPWVISYAQADGNELWRARLLEGETVPSPVFAAGFVLVVSPESKLIALRPDGAGDVSKTHVAWTFAENVPDISSPVSNGELVFMVNAMGTVTCLNAKDGKKIWDKNLETGVQSSPGIAGDRLFILSQNGAVVVLRAGREFQEMGRLQLPEKFQASPAFANGRIYLRGATNLFCLGP